MKRNVLIIMLLLPAALCAALSVASARREQRALSEKLIRIHVIANSDSEYDQKVKLRVRDAVLAVIGERQWDSREEAERDLRTMLPLLRAAADEELDRCGAGYSAEPSLCKESYPTRVYPTFSLPAGDYLSLRVVLGDGDGRNWWCVVYPSICSASAADVTASAAAAGFTKREIRLITEDAKDVKIRFKLLEWLQSCRIF